MNTYYLGGTSMDLIKELNKERLEAEVTPVKVGDTVRVHVKVKEGSVSVSRSSRAPSSPRSTAASPRPSPCAASPTVSVWRRSSRALSLHRQDRGGPQRCCAACQAVLSARPRGQGRQGQGKAVIQDEREAKASLFLVTQNFPASCDFDGSLIY